VRDRLRFSEPNLQSASQSCVTCARLPTSSCYKWQWRLFLLTTILLPSERRSSHYFHLICFVIISSSFCIDTRSLFAEPSVGAFAI
jgi:hypothetical protein